MGKNVVNIKLYVVPLREESNEGFLSMKILEGERDREKTVSEGEERGKYMGMVMKGQTGNKGGGVRRFSVYGKVRREEVVVMGGTRREMARE